MFLWGLILLLPILPNLWAIWHIFKNDFRTPQEKMGWIGACVFLPVVGGLAYVLSGRKRVLPYPATPHEEQQRTEK